MAKPIKFTSIQIENAFTFKKVRADLTGKGLVLVRGRNLDAVQDDGSHSSNGAAKSALFEVIRHVLFGSTARGIKDKEIVRAGSVGGYFGALTLDKAGETFQVHQALKHKQHGSGVLVYRGDEVVTHQKAKVRNQHFVAENLLAMTAEQFDASVFISQEAAHPLVNGTGAECTRYLSATFGLDVYEEFKEKLKDLTKNADKQAGEFSAYEHMVKTAELRLSQLGDITGRREEADRLKEELDELVQLQQKNRTAVAALEKVIEQVKTRAELQSELGDVTMDAASATKKAEKLRDQVKAIDRLLVEVSSVARQLENKAQMQTTLLELLTQVKAAKTACTVVDVGALRDNIKTLEKKRSAADAVAAILNVREQINAGTECSRCGQIVDEEHLAAEIARATEAAGTAVELQEEIDIARAAIDQHQNRKAKYESLVLKADSIKQSIAQLGILNLPDVDVPALTVEKKTLQQELKQLDELLPVIRQLERIPVHADSIEQLTAKHTKLQHVARNIQLSHQQTTEAWQESAMTVREVDRLEKELLDGKKQLDRLAELRRENELRKILGKAMQKLKVRRLHGIVRSIQEAVPPYVAAMFGEDDVRVEIDDDDPDSVERWISRPVAGTTERVRIPVAAMSKGERARLRVAFIWAVRKLMQPERTVNILVLDEADGGLDRQGLEAYSLLLEQLRDQYESIFVISHRPALSTVRFDHVWTVEKKDGVSSLITE